MSGADKSTGGRRTSYALGISTRIKQEQEAMRERYYKNRASLRQKFNERLGLGKVNGKQEFGEEEQEARLLRIHRRMQNKKGLVTFLELKRFMDKNGMAVMYQDGRTLMEEIDANGDGIIHFDELKEFILGTHAVAEPTEFSS